MDSLYTRLAGQWDSLFPPDTERISYLNGLSALSDPGSRFIEVGCGTGATASGLAIAGHSVVASDLDSDMISMANFNAGDVSETSQDYYPDAGYVHFGIDDMSGALEKAPGASADAVLCLGNTLPHLTRPGELEHFLSLSVSTLKTGGVLVIQILNYPRIVGLGSLELPELKGEDGLQFRRRQSFDTASGMIIFETEVEMDGRTEHRDHRLAPIDVEHLNGLAQDAGLKPGGIFRDWNETPFGNDAPWLVSIYANTGGQS